MLIYEADDGQFAFDLVLDNIKNVQPKDTVVVAHQGDVYVATIDEVFPLSNAVTVKVEEDARIRILEIKYILGVAPKG
jgi:hypothetical protein